MLQLIPTPETNSAPFCKSETTKRYGNTVIAKRYGLSHATCLQVNLVLNFSKIWQHTSNQSAAYR